MLLQERDIRKYTLSSGGYKFLIDYVIVNERLRTLTKSESTWMKLHALRSILVHYYGENYSGQNENKLSKRQIKKIKYLKYICWK